MQRTKAKFGLGPVVVCLCCGDFYVLGCNENKITNVIQKKRADIVERFAESVVLSVTYDPLIAPFCEINDVHCVITFLIIVQNITKRS